MLWLLAAPLGLLAAMSYAAFAFLFYLGLFLAWLFGTLPREVRAARDQAGLGPPQPPPAPPGGPVAPVHHSNRRPAVLAT